MMGLQNQIRRTAASLGGDEPVRYGMVSGFDPDTYSVKVRLQPEGTETGWVPLTSEWVGNGWGMFSPPSIGDAVKVEFQEGSASSAVASGRTFNDVDRPLAVQSGEFWLVHKQGAFVKLTNDGKLLINSQLEIDATAPKVVITTTGDVSVTAGGNISASAVQANVVASGSASITAPAITLGSTGQSLKSFITDVFISLFNGHTHKTNGIGAQSDVPFQQMNAGTHATSTVKGG